MKVDLQGPIEELRKLPNIDELAVTAVVHCDATHERRGVPMTRAGAETARWTSLLELDRDDFRGSVRLEAVVTGIAGGLVE